MGQFGEELRKERESRGISLETISEKTKVIVRYLTALEQENFAALPGGILSKGIVRGYTSTVGLDEQVWLKRFVAATREQDPYLGENGWVEFVENVHRSRPARPEHSHRVRWAGLAVLLLVLVGLGWAYWHFVGNRVMAEEVARPGVTATASATPGARNLP